MRRMYTFFAILSSIVVFGQEIKEKTILSKVDKVTVYLNSAQITRTKKVSIPKGVSVLKFTKLSPFIDAKSIQVKLKDIEIQAVNFQKNYLEIEVKNEKTKLLKNRLETLLEELQLQKTYKVIVKEELQFLKENRVLSGKNQALSVAALKSASTFYSTQLKTLKLKEISIDKKIKNIEIESGNVRKQISEFSSVKEFANGEILVKIKASKARNNTIELVYNVSNASWFPSYDVRVKDIQSPMSLVYKANVQQNTKVDWSNVKISFSSATPSLSSTAPNLKTYYLDYGSVPPQYDKKVTTVSGNVRDYQGALPGVNITVLGTTIGTTTDFDGNYSLSIPENAAMLEFSYLGFKTVKKPIYTSVMNVRLEENAESLDEVVVTKHRGRNRKKTLGGAVSSIKSKQENNYTIPTAQIVNQTTVHFEVEAPYSLKSDNKSYALGMKTISLPTKYQYYCVPKIDPTAFLMAHLSNFEQYNLLEGEANIYFENTFIGKSLIDVRFAKDTFQLSLGRDKNVLIQREKIKDYTTKQFLGSKKQEFRGWNIDVKNNKAAPIEIAVFDQIPVSKREEIKITLDEQTQGTFTAKSGEIKWSFTLNSNTSKNIVLKYAVKYPKNSNLIIE